MMPPGFLRLAVGWVALLLLCLLEFGIGFIDMTPAIRPVILIVAFAMVALIAVIFMEAGTGPILIRGFVVVAIFWMTILIGLGSIDPLTRVQSFTTTDDTG